MGMFVPRWNRLRWAGLVVFLIPALLPAPDAVADENAPVKIGLPATLFRDIPKITIDALMPTFTKLMEAQTGVRGQIVLLKGGNDVAQQLHDNRIQFAVLHGFEFAWAQTKYKDLKPLVIAVSNQSPSLTAQVVVASDSSYAKLEELKGQKVALPRGTREHCLLFLPLRLHSIIYRL